jgi:hypothetical protein
MVASATPLARDIFYLLVAETNNSAAQVDSGVKLVLRCGVQLVSEIEVEPR